MSRSVLEAIGRRHSPEDVVEAVRLAGRCEAGVGLRTSGTQERETAGAGGAGTGDAGAGGAGVAGAEDAVAKTGFALNMDVIAGLPGDDPLGFQRTLDTVLGMSPENITIHTLSLKKGSRIMLESTAIPTGTEVAKMLELAARRLRGSGYSPYYLYRQKFTSGGFENTGWSLPGYEGIYNICMMEELCTVLALGGGGATKLVSHDGRIERVFNAKYPREYIMQEEKRTGKFRKIEEFLSGPLSSGAE